MTSAIGDRRALREGGFTLIEILVVMAIIAFLAALILVATGPIFRRASRTSTEGMMQRLQTYIMDYTRKKGRLPPDGFDTKVRSPEGTDLQGSAALYYHLTQPIRVKIDIAGEDKIVTYEPVADFKSGELLVIDDEDPAARYIVDGFGVPIHYDNQTKKVDLPKLDDEDPGEDSPVGRWQFGGYELWSMGWRQSSVEEWEEEEEAAEELEEE